MDKDDWAIWAVVATIVAIGFITIAIFATDNIDVDDTLGPYMCAQHGLEFVSAEQRCMGLGDDCSVKNMELKIYCKNITKTLIDDGYLILV